MRKRIFVVGLLTPVFLLVFFSIALAQRPDVGIYKYQYPWPDTIVCDGGAFELEIDEYISVVVTTFYDKDGNEKRTQINFTSQGTVLNTETQTTYQLHTSFNEFYGPDEAKFIGLIWNISIPGEGVLVLDVGRLVFDESGVSFSGHTVPEFKDSDITLICDGVRGV